MFNLLTIKEKAKNIYAEHEFVLKPIFKFIFSFVALVILKENIGYAPIINMWPVLVFMAVVMAFIPVNFDVIIATVVMIVDVFYQSKELAGVISAIFIILLVLFLRFTPKQGVFLLLVPLAFFLKIPYVIPLVAGLVSTPVAIVSVTFGTIIYYVIDVINKHSDKFASISSEATGGKKTFSAVSDISEIVFNRPDIYLSIVVFALTIAIVYGIKRRSIDYSWQIAVVAGSIIQLALMLVGSIVLKVDADMLWIVLGNVIAFAIAYILQLLIFSVDYSRTENTQFEDDEYYYYVKAVPKINVTAPEMNVKRINAQRRKKSVPMRREN